MTSNGHGDARALHAGFKHPIIDADGHWLEYGPVMREEFRRIGGDAADVATLTGAGSALARARGALASARGALGSARGALGSARGHRRNGVGSA